MALPLPPRNNSPIPNSPFYYPQEDAVASSSGPLVVGAGLAVDYADGTLVAAGGGLANVTATLPLYLTGIQSNPVFNIETANKFRLGVVQVGDNIDLSGVGVIGVASSTVTNKGVVQLADTTSSTSKFLALTANQGYLLQQQISSLVVSSDLILAGTFNPATAQMTKVTTKGLEAGFVLNNNLPLPGPENEGYFVILSERGIYTPPGSSTPIDGHVGSWFLSTGSQWNYLKISEQVPSATETSGGIIRLATLQEAIDGTNDTAAMTPLKVAEVAVEESQYTTKGDILVAQGAAQAVALPVGNDGQVLTADAASPLGMQWTDAACDIPCSTIANLGSLVVGTGPNTPGTLPIGQNAQYLQVNYNCPTGLEWVTVTNNFAIPCSILTSAGTLVTANGPSSPVALPRGANRQILTVCQACAATGGLTWANNTSINECYLLGQPRGSLISSTGAAGNIATQLGVGDNPAADGLALVSCSISNTGLCWAKASPPESCFTAIGQLYVGSGIKGLCAFNVGSNGQVLTADSTAPVGVSWCALPSPTKVNATIVVGETREKNQSCDYVILPTAAYPAGCWMVSVWGSACNQGGSACAYTVLGGSPRVNIEYPNSQSETPFSQTWFVDNSGGCVIWTFCNSSTGAGPQDIVYCAYYSALLMP